MQPTIAEEIRNLVRGAIDWDFLLLAAADHSVTPLLCRQLPAVAADLVESARIEHLNVVARANAMRTLVLTAEIVTITDALRSAGVHAIPYKGPILAAQAYGDVALREFEDLDLVLRQSDMPKADTAIISLGYRPKFPLLSSGAAGSIVPAEYAYWDESRRMMVELHTERTLRHFPLPPDLDDLAGRLVPISLGGHELRTFAPEDMLILLCIHGSKHFWERLSWTADVAEFVQASPQLDWGQVFRRARSLRATRMVAINLTLAHRLFGLPLPPGVLAVVHSDSSASSIAEQIERSLLARQSPELGAVARFHLRRHLLDGFFEGWRYSFRLTTLPSDEDWATIQLPSSLAPLYSVLRPFRLLRKYGVSGGHLRRESFAGKKASN